MASARAWHIAPASASAMLKQSMHPSSHQQFSLRPQRSSASHCSSVPTMAVSHGSMESRINAHILSSAQQISTADTPSTFTVVQSLSTGQKKRVCDFFLFLLITVCHKCCQAMFSLCCIVLVSRRMQKITGMTLHKLDAVIGKCE